jgi:hypothetical protein
MFGLTALACRLFGGPAILFHAGGLVSGKSCRCSPLGSHFFLLRPLNRLHGLPSFGSRCGFSLEFSLCPFGGLTSLFRAGGLVAGQTFRCRLFGSHTLLLCLFCRLPCEPLSFTFSRPG